MNQNNLDTSLLKPGDILCVGEKKFDIFTAGIKLLTKSKVNHVGIIDKVGNDLVVYEAKLLAGFVKTPLEAYLKRYSSNEIGLAVVRVKESLFSSTSPKEDAYNRVISTAVYLSSLWAKFNIKYDVTAIVGFNFICWFKIIGRKLNIKNNWLQSKNKLFCSESVCIAYYKALQSISFPISSSLFAGKIDTDANCATISPKDIRKSSSVYLVTGDEDML